MFVKSVQRTTAFFMFFMSWYLLIILPIGVVSIAIYQVFSNINELDISNILIIIGVALFISLLLIFISYIFKFLAKGVLEGKKLMIFLTALIFFIVTGLWLLFAYYLANEETPTITIAIFLTSFIYSLMLFSIILSKGLSNEA